jgi:type IV pilus assembly protein PilV
MSKKPAHAPRRDRGTTLLEAMIALTILLVGILGMMQLQVLGITSNAGARSYSQALQVAHELAAALEQLPANDPLLDPQFTGGANPDPAFGSVLSAPNTLRSTSTFKEYDDTSANVRGAASNAAITATYGSDPTEAAPRYMRRWQVWQAETAATGGGVKAIAVSVTYREPRLPGLREVVLLTQVSNRGLASAFAAAYR